MDIHKDGCRSGPFVGGARIESSRVAMMGGAGNLSVGVSKDCDYLYGNSKNEMLMCQQKLEVGLNQ